MKPSKLFELLKQEKIIGAKGEIFFKMQGVMTPVNDSSVVGNIIQDWLKGFLEANKIDFKIKLNTQEFPDFMLDKDSDLKGLLEVKCFKKSPNFDVANFKAYARSLLSHAYRLDADYLIFEYVVLDEGGIKIKNMWLKKVWEICTDSERSPLKIQWKQSSPDNIRPATWYSKKAKYKPFKSRLDFVEAIKKVVDMSGSTSGIQNKWIDKVKTNYKKFTGSNL